MSRPVTLACGPNLALAATNLDGSAAIVVLNMGNTAADYEITIGNQAIDATIPGAAIQTVLLKP